MKKITMYLGLNDQDTKHSKVLSGRGLQNLYEFSWRFFGGGTISE